MKGYDYKFKFIPSDTEASPRYYSYHRLLEIFEMGDAIVHGRPMSSGGAPQALSLRTVLESKLGDTKVEVYFNGSQVF